MIEPLKFRVLADEHIVEEDTVSADELFDDIMAGFAELQAFEESSIARFSEGQPVEEGKTLRVTEFVDGKRLQPTEITAAELKARQAARNAEAKSAQNDSVQGATGETLPEKAMAG